jgi:hypothetical protein
MTEQTERMDNDRLPSEANMELQRRYCKDGNEVWVEMLPVS